MSKRIVGIGFNDGKVTEITLDGILDNETDVTDRVIFKRAIYAQWIDTDTKCNDNDLYTCSHCGGYMEISRKYPSYCPWCGSTMIKDGDE